MSRPPSPEQLAAECDAFNAICAIGQRVYVRKDSGDIVETVTTTAAQVLSGHTAVVWLRDIRGCYLLSRVKPILGALS